MHLEVRVVSRNGIRVNHVLTSEFGVRKAVRELASARREFPHCQIVLTKRDGDSEPVVIA